MLNWVYVDRNTYEIKYGIRADAQSHLKGPWNCTRQDRRMTFEGWEGFVAVEEEENLWAVRFDRDDDGLRQKISGKRVLEIELTRTEKRWKQDPTARRADQATIHSSGPMTLSPSVQSEEQDMGVTEEKDDLADELLRASESMANMSLQPKSVIRKDSGVSLRVENPKQYSPIRGCFSPGKRKRDLRDEGGNPRLDPT